jgi:hypothetical protein
MAALTSPVKAPWGTVWQFWAPTWADVDFKAERRADKKGKGGQMMMWFDVEARASAKEGIKASIKAKEPFIFQFETIIFTINFPLIVHFVVPKALHLLIAFIKVWIVF